MYSGLEFLQDAKLKKLLFEIENSKDKKMQSSKVIFPLTVSHVIIKISKEEHKIIFCAKVHKVVLLKKLFAQIKREKKIV